MKKSGHTHLFAWIAAAALISLAVMIWMLWGRTAVRRDASAKDDSLQKVLNSGRFIFGFDADFPPMSFADEKGEFTGFDIDMIQEVCNRLGVELVKQPINWDTKEDDLNGGRADCLGSLSITLGRAERMNLSEPYVKEDLIFVVPGNSDTKWLRDLKGKKVGVQTGSTTLEALEKLDIYKDILVVPFEENLALLQQLKEGKLDAALVDSLVAYSFMYSSNERYFVLPESLGQKKFVLGFRKNDKELRNKVQDILGEMKASGALGKISKKWFESDITIIK